ncbi:MAG: hypothetical protein QXM31_00750 [Candidatus Woesearchaeota archaeon]
MARITVLLIALLLFAGCVQIPEETNEKPEDSIYEPAEGAPAPLPEAAEPNPLAPLPKPVSEPAVRPKAIVPNTTASNTSAPSKPANKTVQSGWTTESLSIAEGETKYVYIKQ